MANRALLYVPDNLRSMQICGHPLADALSLACAAVGLSPEIAGGPDLLGEGSIVVIDGRYAALSAPTLEPLAKDSANAALVGPKGNLLAVRIESPDPRLTVAEALAAKFIREFGAPQEESWPVTDNWTLSLVEATVRRRRLRDLARSGVRILDHRRVMIDLSVRIAPGAIIWPDVVLRGKTDIESGVEVQSGCWIEDTRIASHAAIKPHTVCINAEIAEGATVGPFAHIRPGTKLEADVKIGNFVEVKQSVVREGAKASHLTYIGDAEVGPGANIGAGTITCNYDGVAKHPTTIGAGAFVGSNTSLVAPVNVGDGAIIGAGSVITRDVPENALAVERGDFKMLEGKAPAIHERNRRRAAEAHNE